MAVIGTRTRTRGRARPRRAITAALAALLVAGGIAAPAVTASAAPVAAQRSLAQRRLDAMTPAERVGQLLMVGCSSTAVTAACLTAIRDLHVGSVILDGDSTLSVAAEHRITAALQHAAPRTVQLLVATDQEGGLVRRMRGPGFDAAPTALVQGTWSSAHLRRAAATWGAQLRRAGIGLDLAPVLDTVPAGSTDNPPIGAFDREYGRTSARVTEQGVAVLRGLEAGGVSTAVKHFPGLGKVTGNTDTTAGVTDRTTTAHDAYLRPFAAAITAGTGFVMMSSAVYPRIDARNPAAFSRAAVTDLLRGRLGFRGVVISDDLGAAVQVASVPVGQRATRFINAGGDLVLTVRVGQAKAMSAAVLARMTASPAFARQVDAAALRVLQQKQARGLLR